MEPNLLEIRLVKDQVENWSQFPFTIPVIKSFDKLNFNSKVTFFVGENGSGKSTLLEAIADNYGFSQEGGSKNISFQTSHDNSVKLLSDAIKLSWTRKILQGYFFRAESFFNLATHLDNLQRSDSRTYMSYGGKSLHKQSHGESFLSLFKNRFSRGGFFLLDEPEAALSSEKQLALISILNQISKNKDTQFIIATHSPILLGYPDAQIYSFDSGKISQIAYKETKPYIITKTFLNNKEKYLKELS